MICGHGIPLPPGPVLGDGTVTLRCKAGHEVRLQAAQVRATRRHFHEMTCGKPSGDFPSVRLARVDVLCGCGWGRLAMLEDEVPSNCPICGHEFGGGE